jgi:Flp pilus assembly protein TadB
VPLRRLIAFVCLAVALAAAVSLLSGSLLWAVVVPAWLFVVCIVTAALVRELESFEAQLLTFLSAVGSRAPPR